MTILPTFKIVPVEKIMCNKALDFLFFAPGVSPHLKTKNYSNDLFPLSKRNLAATLPKKKKQNWDTNTKVKVIERKQNIFSVRT
jgi:hypothetical protein